MDEDLLGGAEGNRLTVVVEDGCAGQRLDRFLAQQIDVLSRSRLQALIRNGAVCLNDRCVDDPKYKVRIGDVFDVNVPPAEPARPIAETMALDVVHEDDHVIVINKPAGLVVHPSAGHETGTLVNGLIAHCGDGLSGIGGVRRPGIVHRLDKDTTGLLVVAKTDVAHQGLSVQFAAHGSDGRLHRAYVALCWGCPLHRSGRIDAALGRSPINRLKMAVVGEAKGRFAATNYEILETLGQEVARKPAGKTGLANQNAPTDDLVCEMRLLLETGRTHQIRVHLAHIGHPVIGDPLYALGFRSRSRRFDEGVAHLLDETKRQMLHAGELGFVHPVTQQSLEFSRAPPDDYLQLKAMLKKE